MIISKILLHCENNNSHTFENAYILPNYRQYILLLRAKSGRFSRQKQRKTRRNVHFLNMPVTLVGKSRIDMRLLAAYGTHHALFPPTPLCSETYLSTSKYTCTYKRVYVCVLLAQHGLRHCCLSQRNTLSRKSSQPFSRDSSYNLATIVATLQAAQVPVYLSQDYTDIPLRLQLDKLGVQVS